MFWIWTLKDQISGWYLPWMIQLLHNMDRSNIKQEKKRCNPILISCTQHNDREEAHTYQKGETMIMNPVPLQWWTFVRRFFFYENAINKHCPAQAFKESGKIWCWHGWKLIFLLKFSRINWFSLWQCSGWVAIICLQGCTFYISTYLSGITHQLYMYSYLRYKPFSSLLGSLSSSCSDPYSQKYS